MAVNPESTENGALVAALVVAIVYPLAPLGSDTLAAEIAAVAAVDPRIELIVEPYEEPHSLRSARGLSPGADLRALAPALTAAQRAVFSRAEVIMALDLPFDMHLLAPRLRWVQAIGAGTTQLQGAVADTDVVVTNNSGANSVSIAEFVMGRLLQHRKRFRELDVAQQRHEWSGLNGGELEGTTLGLVGLGAISSALAVRARAFDMHVLACRRSSSPSPLADGLFAPEELHDMLRRCDAVVAAVPETAETVGMFDAAAFAAMRKGAFFCNVGRGSLVDESALIAALGSGQLSGAALDVVSQEPLPAEHPLWDARNIYISPHCATARGTFVRNVYKHFRENLARYLTGEPLRGLVDPGRGY